MPPVGDHHQTNTSTPEAAVYIDMIMMMTMMTLMTITIIIMTKKTWTKIDKKGHEEEWSWEETPELLVALKELALLKAQDDLLNYDTSGK